MYKWRGESRKEGDGEDDVIERSAQRRCGWEGEREYGVVVLDAGVFKESESCSSTQWIC